MQVLADGILPWPEAARQRFVDDGDRRRGTVVAIREIPPGDECDLERLEMSRAYRVHVDHRHDGLPPRDGFGVAVPEHDAHAVRERQRHDVKNVRRDDARRRFETLDQLANELAAARLGVAACLEIDRRGLHVRGFETELQGSALRKSRMKSPAVISRRTDIDTCATRNVERNHPCRGPSWYPSAH